MNCTRDCRQGRDCTCTTTRCNPDFPSVFDEFYDVLAKAVCLGAIAMGLFSAAVLIGILVINR